MLAAWQLAWHGSVVQALEMKPGRGSSIELRDAAASDDEMDRESTPDVEAGPQGCLDKVEAAFNNDENQKRLLCVCPPCWPVIILAALGLGFNKFCEKVAEKYSK